MSAPLIAFAPKSLVPVSNLAIRLQEIDDTELEEFIELWIERKSQRYVRVDRIGAANDKGRDVIAFLSERSHQLKAASSVSGLLSPRRHNQNGPLPRAE